MATQKKDVELGIGVNVKNTERVKALTEDLNSLAQSGKAATPEFERLASELEQLGKQAGAAESLQQVETELTQTAEAMSQAFDKSEQLARSLDEQRKATQNVRDAQKIAQETYDNTRIKLAEVKGELDELRASTDRAGKSSEDYIDRQRNLKEQIAGLETSAKKQGIALQQANRELRDSNAELGRAESAANKTQKAVDQLSRKYDEQTQAVIKARDALTQTGASADAAEQAQQALAAAIDDVAKASTEYNRLRTQSAEIEAAVAEANERNVNLAKRAAAERETAARAAKAAANEQAAAETKLSYALDEVAAREAEVAENARQAGNALDKAFSVTGARSIAAIKADIDEVNRSLALLQSQGLSKLELDRAFAGANERVKELKRELSSVPGQFNLVGASVDFLKNQFVQLAAAYQGIDLASKFLQANIQIEGLRRTLTISTGSFQEAERQIAFLRKTADLTGQSFSQIADEYKKFSISLSTSGYSLSQTEELFLAVASAAGKLGLSSDKTGNILNALSQIANKGVVSMEELRGQMGESLPGALQLAADATGISTDRLIKLIETGQVLSRDMLPYLAKAMTDKFGDAKEEVQGFQAEWNRLSNAITKLSQDANDSTFFKALTTSVAFAADNFKGLADAAFIAGKAFAAFKLLDYLGQTKAVAEATRLLTTEQKVNTEVVKQNTVQKELNTVAEAQGSVARKKAAADVVAETAALQANTAVTSTNTASKTGAIASLGRMGQAVTATAGSAAAMASTLAAGIGRFGAWGAAAYLAYSVAKDLSDVIADGVFKLTGYNERIAEAERVSASLQKRLAEAEEGRRQSYLLIQDRFQDAIKSSEQAVVVADKEVKAIEARSAMQVGLAKLYGDTTIAAVAEAKASENIAQALQGEADVRELQATLLEKKVSALQAAAEANNENNETVLASIESERKNAEGLRAAAEAARAKAQAANDVATASQSAALALKDNSGRVDELKLAYEAASKEVETLRYMQERGVVTGETVAAGMRQQVLALNAYRDALADSAARLRLSIETLRVDTQTRQAGLSVKLAEAQASEKVAQAYGNERGALDAQIVQKRVSIEQTRAAAQAKIDEADATIKELQLQKELITGSDDLAVRQRAEIELRIKSEQAKKKEAEASDSVVKGLEAEIDAVERAARAKAIANQANNVGGIRNASDNIQIDENGRSDYQRNLMSQQGGPVDNSFIFQLRDRLARGDSFAASELPAIENAYRVALENQKMMASTKVPSLEGMRDADSWVNTLRNVVERAGGSTSGGITSGKSVGLNTSSHTVTVKFGSSSKTVNTASAADAKQLSDLFKELENQSNRAS